MYHFRIVYIDDNDSKRFKTFKAASQDEAIAQAERWLQYNTTFQLGSIIDCIRMRMASKVGGV